MPHSFKIENKMLLNRLDVYKKKIGYIDTHYSDFMPKESGRKQRTPSEEAARKEQFEVSEREQREIKLEM